MQDIGKFIQFDVEAGIPVASAKKRILEGVSRILSELNSIDILEYLLQDITEKLSKKEVYILSSEDDYFKIELSVNNAVLVEFIRNIDGEMVENNRVVLSAEIVLAIFQDWLNFLRLHSRR